MERQADLPPAPSIPAELPVLNAEALERIAEYLAPPVINTYLRAIVSRCLAASEALHLPNAVDSCDEALAETIHALAGSAGMLGFSRLSDDGVRLERALRGRSPEARIMANRLADTIEATLGEIQKLLAQR